MPGKAEESVLQLIDEKELVDLAVAMGNITAPSGYEQPMADFVLNWLKANGFDNSFQQQVADGRSNVIGIFRGTGAGRSLIFNSHLDSEQGMPMRLGEEPPPVDTPETSMWRDINIFNEVGIPAATFGMQRKRASDAPERFVEIQDIVDGAKMYALVALDVCRS